MTIDEKKIKKMFKEQNLYLEKRMKFVFAEGFDQIVMPHLEKIYKKQGEHDEKFEDVILKLDSIERKQDTEIECVDRHGIEIKAIKQKISI